MRKIKLFIYSCLLGISALPVQAKVITQSQAQALAAKYVSVGNGSKQQTFSAARKSGQQDAPSFYAFNDSKGKGFVLIAGDDCVNPVLGYSPSGSIDTSNLPPALEAWLQDVSSYINSKRESGNGMAMTASNAEQGSTPSVVVAPLIKTKWDQKAPYNDMTPTIDGEHCLTGCVATAMAQVMNYYKWPMKGTNSIKYDTPNYDQKICDVDFTQSVYDWDNMLDVYGTYSEPDNFTCSEANRKAVAQLMRDTGAAVYMEYGISAGSGANSPEILSAATYYLGYNAQYYHKNDYTMKQWLSLIKSNLDNGCPLVYCGDTKMLPIIGMFSHCYIVDGYDSNNYLHVNWGWSGNSDGYYSFYKFGTNPASYYSENMNFVKMTPNKTGIIEWDAANPLRMNASASKISVNGKVCEIGETLTSDVDNLNADLDIHLLSLVWNLYQGDIQLGYTTQHEEFTSLVCLKEVSIKADEKGFTQGKVRFHVGSADIKNLADGSYQLTMLSKRTNSGMSVNGSPTVPAINDARYNLMLIKQNGKVSIGFVPKQRAHLTAKSKFLMDKEEYDITDLPKASIKVSNETDIDFLGNPQLIVTNNTDSTIYFSLLNEPTYLYGGDSTEMIFDIPISSNAGFLEGVNKVMLGQYLDGKVIPLKDMEPVTIKVNNNKDKIPHLEVEDVELLAGDDLITDYDNIMVDYDCDLKFAVDFKCSVNTMPAYCMIPLELTMKYDDGTNISKDVKRKFESVERSETVDIFGSFDFYDIGKTGIICVQYIPMFDTKPHYVQYKGKDMCFKFKVVDTTTGIKDVTSGNKASELMRFDVMGNRINTPAKGLNLIKLSDGTVKKVIVK